MGIPVRPLTRGRKRSISPDRQRKKKRSEPEILVGTTNLRRRRTISRNGYRERESITDRFRRIVESSSHRHDLNLLNEEVSIDPRHFLSRRDSEEDGGSRRHSRHFSGDSAISEDLGERPERDMQSPWESVVVLPIRRRRSVHFQSPPDDSGSLVTSENEAQLMEDFERLQGQLQVGRENGQVADERFEEYVREQFESFVRHFPRNSTFRNGLVDFYPTHLHGQSALATILRSISDHSDPDC